MKKHYTLFLFCAFFSCKINAQNWQAISPQHIYNYQVNADINAFYNTKINTMVNIFVDSIIATNGNVTQYALNTVFDRQVPENGQYQIIHQPQFLQKEMWVQNDTFFFQNPANPQTIPTKAQIGQTWIFDAAQNITANVADIQATTTFGQADSVKIMVLSTNDSLILSKEFGIIRFPFAYNSPYFYQLVGINDLHLGTTVPMFEDIFNFEVGDMFEYHTNDVYPQFTIESVEKYEITSKNFVNDTFYYNVLGLYKSKQYGNPIGTIFHYDSIYQAIFYRENTYPKLDNFNFENYIYSGNVNYIYWATNNVVDTTFLGYQTISRSPSRYSTNCLQVGQPAPMNIDSVCNGESYLFFEHTRTFTAAKGLGFIYRSQADDNGGPGTYTYNIRELVAFRKNGITYGTFTPDSLLIAGIENSKNSSFYQLFPNPTTANITLLFDKEDNYEGTIYNVLGEKGSSFSIENKKEQIIDLQNFPAGMYYLEVVNSKGKRSVHKVMKQ